MILTLFYAKNLTLGSLWVLASKTFKLLCVISNICGCAGFVQDITDTNSSFCNISQNGSLENIENVIIADYTDLGNHSPANINDLLQIDQSVRNQIENSVSKKIAMQIIQRLAKSESEIESKIQAGYSLAKNMSWDAVVKNYLLSSLQDTPHKQRSESICTKT